jgi:hypothetical protein
VAFEGNGFRLEAVEGIPTVDDVPATADAF